MAESEIVDCHRTCKTVNAWDIILFAIEVGATVLTSSFQNALRIAPIQSSLVNPSSLATVSFGFRNSDIISEDRVTIMIMILKTEQFELYCSSQFMEQVGMFSPKLLIKSRIMARISHIWIYC